MSKPPIVRCPKCGKRAPWVQNKEKYGRNYGSSYMCYFCAPCGTYVGCHENTRWPLGTMADAETLEWRKKAHAVIDPLWRNATVKRARARGHVYKRLKELFGREIHIGESDIETCKKIIGWANELPRL